MEPSGAFELDPSRKSRWGGRFNLQVGAGLATIHADAKLSYVESFTITGVGGPPPTRTDVGTNDEWLFGFYGEAKVQYWINPVVALYMGGQYQALDDFTIRAFNKEATVNFGESFALVFGVLYSF